MAKIFDDIKKQINTQTREKVGSMKIESVGTTYITQPTPGDMGTDPIIVWDKVWYSRNRGELFSLSPSVFNDPIASKSTQMIYTNVGNFTDRAAAPHCNTRYSGYAGIQDGGTISFRVVAQGSVTIYIDQQLSHSSGNELAQPIDLSISILNRSLIQIYWYAENEGDTFALSGNISRYLTLWEQSDVTPFWDTVEWYPEDPVSVNQSGGGGAIPIAVVTLRWWFGEEELEVVDGTPLNTDLGGFGLWQIEFQEIGEIDVIGDSISVSGYYPNIRYLRIDGVIYKPLYTVPNLILNSTIFTFENHGLTDADDGSPVEIGTLKLIRNLPISDFGDIKTSYEVNDTDITWGVTYYYLIDCYDSSPNRNRGGLTESVQMVTAGDTIPPLSPINLTGVRNAIDSVTLSWGQEELTDVDHWIVYSDAGNVEYSPIVSSFDQIAMLDYLPFRDALLENPNGFLISIELPSGEKLVRLVTEVSGSMLTINEDLPTIITGTSTIRFVSLLATLANTPVGVPRPRPIDDLIEVDAIDPSRSGELIVVE